MTVRPFLMLLKFIVATLFCQNAAADSTVVYILLRLTKLLVRDSVTMKFSLLTFSLSNIYLSFASTQGLQIGTFSNGFIQFQCGYIFYGS